jgi:hypothetical protein
MSKPSKPQPAAEAPKRGDAAWRAAKAEIASRNEHAQQLGRERRQTQNEQYAAEQLAAERRERAELAKRRP